MTEEQTDDLYLVVTLAVMGGCVLALLTNVWCSPASFGSRMVVTSLFVFMVAGLRSECRHLAGLSAWRATR